MLNRGFIGTLVLILIGLAALKYFLNWDIFDAVASPKGQSTILYLREIINTAWSYIQQPLSYLWNQIIWPLLGGIINSLRNMMTKTL